jgi:molybdenum cofactor sulfurtransferase
MDYSDEEKAPDFTCLSFYKIFGFPDLGALIVRKSAGKILRSRRAFFGGTVDMVISLGEAWHSKKPSSLHDCLEDGTLPFHSIFALDHALDVHKNLFGSMKQISSHTARLTKVLYDSMMNLQHYNGQRVVRVYNDRSAIYGDPATQGATIAFNLIRPDGVPIGYQDVEKLANQSNIYLRSGSLCNPGGFATYLSWTSQDLKSAFDHGHTCSNPVQNFNGKSTGVVRASLGAMSNMTDVETLVNFIKSNFAEMTYCEPLQGQLQSDQHRNRGDSFAASENSDKGVVNIASVYRINAEESGSGKRRQKRLRSSIGSMFTHIKWRMSFRRSPSSHQNVLPSTTAASA